MKQAADVLERANVERPDWTARQILSRRLGCSPHALLVEPPVVTPEQQIQFEMDVAARAGGVPLQQILQTADFYGREFRVGLGVFIPRPETEVLVEAALSLLAHSLIHSSTHPLSLVEVGTGSGCIAVTLALEGPGLSVRAVEQSAQALFFAKENAKRHRARVKFSRGDLLAGFPADSEDFIAANLPYLDREEAHTWPREVRWDPWLALDGGEKGMELILKLIGQAAVVLKKGGFLLLEIGHGQVDPLKRKAVDLGLQVDRVVQDLAGLDRVIILRRTLPSLRAPKGRSNL